MSKLDITTQDLLLRLGTTSMSRSAKADALFRRLRMDTSPAVSRKLMQAPRRLQASDFTGARDGDAVRSEKQ